MRNIVITLLLLCLTMPLSAGNPKAPKKKEAKEAVGKEPTMQRIAIFGVGVSFTDSIVYQTEVQMLDSAWIEPDHKFLHDRSLYSLQLQYYMERQGIKNSICTVLFHRNPNRLQRKWERIRKRHQKHTAQRFKQMSLSDFKFTGEEYRPVMIEEREE